MAEIVAINISEEKGVQKHEVPSAELRKNHGIVGDAHAGDWHRQVSLLADESIEKMRKMGLDLDPGAFAENIVTRGIILFELPVGTRLQLGETALGEVTQIGKKCHTGCAIAQTAGKCIMPTEGIFVKILEDGQIFPGDTIEVLP